MKLLNTTLILCLLLLSSCNLMHCPTKEAFIRSYSEFVQDVEQKRIDKATTWTSEDQQFKDYVDRCYQEFKSELTLEEKKTFWSKTLKYYYNRYEGNLTKAYDDAKANLSDDFNKDINEMIKNADGDILEMVKDLFGKDLKKGIDGILDAINDFGEKLKEELESK